MCSAGTNVVPSSPFRRSTLSFCKHMHATLLQLRPDPNVAVGVSCRLARWSQLVRAITWYKSVEPSGDTIMALELCVSDKNKPLVLANPDFIPVRSFPYFLSVVCPSFPPSHFRSSFGQYLVDALLLDPDHPRVGMTPELKAWCQEHHAECLAQLAVFEPAREALRQDPSVISAMESVAEVGLSAVARQFAQAALLALNDKEMHVNVHVDDQRHVMLSYQWDKQATVKRLNDSLIGRGYVTWFDLSNMKGSVLDAMSEAVEGAEVMLYG